MEADPDKLATALLGRMDAYYTPAAFVEGAAEKTIANVRALRSWFVDLDGKLYSDGLKGATNALIKWVSAARLPPPSLIVQSGGGLHVYWTTEEEHPLSTWRSLAAALRTSCERNGVLADHMLTTQPATFLRPPGTFNAKYSPPRLVRVLRWGEHTTVSALMQAVEAQPSNVVPFRGNRDLTSGVTRRKAWAAGVFAQCPTMQHARDTGGVDNDYLGWKGILHVLAYLEDGKDWIHKVSCNHPGYKPSDTEFKFNESLKSVDTVGPTTCQSLSTVKGSKCATCPLRGSIKTPVALGYMDSPPVPETDEGSEAPPPPTFSLNGATYTRISVDGETKNVKVLDTVTEHFRLFADPAHGRCLVFDARTDKNTTTSIRVLMRTAVDTKTLGAHLLAAGVAAPPDKLKLFGGALVAWMSRLQKQAAVETSKPFGWTNTGDFALNGTLYLKGGGTRPGALPDPVLGAAFQPTGSYDTWKEAAKVFRSDGRVEMEIMLAAALGSPLLRWCEAPAFNYGFVSQGSGVGKTTFARFALSFYGSPRALLHNTDDTNNAITAKMASTSYMPTVWDEIRTQDDTKRLSQVLFRTYQGLDKHRLSLSAEQKLAAEINTVMITCSNLSLVEEITALHHGQPAGLYRMLEFDVRPIGKGADAMAFPQAAQDVTRNYGHAGVAFVRHVVDNAERIEQVYKQIKDKLIKSLGYNPEERFWIQSAALTVCAAVEAARAGIYPFRPPEIATRLLQAIRRYRVSASMVDANLPKNVVARVRNAMADMSLIVRKIGAKSAVLSPPIGRTVACVISIEDDTLAMAAWAVEDFCARKGLSLVEIKRAMAAAGGVSKRIALGTGTEFAQATTMCYVFTASEVMGEEFMQTWRSRLRN
jgi:hypothetical protein